MNAALPFIVAVLGLLAVPGPTNTLMAAAGAANGVARSLRLLIGELGGYVIAITVWTELVGAAAAQQPMIAVAAKLLAAAFLLWSAYRLWSRAGTHPAGGSITLQRVFTTTLINPKGLVFAFAIFPPVGFVVRLPYLGVFAVLVVVTAIGWQTLGAAAALSSRGLFTAARVERVCAIVLAVFAIVLIVQTVQGLH
jgi:threonine/homoserine/homoserine lactone efflux protein